MCCRICQFRAAPNIQGLQGFCRPNAAASIQKCVAEIKPAPKGRNSIRASPTNCYCQHTHVCRRMEHLEFHPRIKGYKGSPDHLLQRAYTCVFQNKSNQGCTQGSICYKGPADQLAWLTTCCGGHTHRCVSKQVKSGLHPRVEMSQRRSGRPGAAVSIHMCAAEQ